MKKSVVLLIVLLCASMLTLAACQPDESGKPQNDTAVSSAEADDAAGKTDDTKDDGTDSLPADNNVSSEQPADDTARLPEYQPGSIRLVDQDQDDYNFQRKYRISYYRIWGEFTECLTEEQNQDYMEWVDKKSKEDGYGKNRNEMLLASFIKRYNIPREEFDKAVRKYTDKCIELGWDTTTEEYEVPNGDIIYTFDNAIINHYYRYA